ncbi:MAG: hypothetical protein N2Z73_03710 [Endomicrobia bacterium]|nr:hypothetical protein [Endomicrobiia bacterium]
MEYHGKGFLEELHSESKVEEIKVETKVEKLDAKINLPISYYHYLGGEFSDENYTSVIGGHFM